MILHMFPLRQALWLASGMYLLSAMVLVWRVTRAAPANQPEAIPIIVRTYLFGALLVLLCYLLVRYRDNLRRLRHQHDLLERMAFVDALTEVHNRRYVDHQLREQISLVRRYQQPLSVLLCDIDHFKQINDHLGHSGGDRVLVEVARLLRAHVRGADIVGRWGGEEFIVVMHMTDVEGALTVAERMRVAVEQSPVVAGRAVTVSIGVSTHEPGDTFDSLLHRADDALYRAKRAGRNRVTVAAQQLA
jgi:diguanylate cyclase (GGDEF)-like protein